MLANNQKEIFENNEHLISHSKFIKLKLKSELKNSQKKLKYEIKNIQKQLRQDLCINKIENKQSIDIKIQRCSYVDISTVLNDSDGFGL